MLFRQVGNGADCPIDHKAEEKELKEHAKEVKKAEKEEEKREKKEEKAEKVSWLRTTQTARVDS